MEPDRKYVGFSREDRDLLIELRTNVNNITKAIEELKDTTGRTVADHETRLRFLERWVWSAIAVLAVAEAALRFFLK